MKPLTPIPRRRIYVSRALRSRALARAIVFLTVWGSALLGCAPTASSSAQAPAPGGENAETNAAQNAESNAETTVGAKPKLTIEPVITAAVDPSGVAPLRIFVDALRSRVDGAVIDGSSGGLDYRDLRITLPFGSELEEASTEEEAAAETIPSSEVV